MENIRNLILQIDIKDLFFIVALGHTLVWT